MNKNQKVTIWSKLEKGCYEHNHVENGWVSGASPVPNSEIQKGSWKNGKWLKYLAYQDDLNLVEKTLQVD